MARGQGGRCLRTWPIGKEDAASENMARGQGGRCLSLNFSCRRGRPRRTAFTNWSKQSSPRKSIHSRKARANHLLGAPLYSPVHSCTWGLCRSIAGTVLKTGVAAVQSGAQLNLGPLLKQRQNCTETSAVPRCTQQQKVFTILSADVSAHNSSKLVKINAPLTQPKPPRRP